MRCAGAVCRIYPNGRAIAEAFDEIAPENCDLVLMDEIGRMERHADTYSARIRTLLDGCVPILGVVQKKADTPLAAAIRSHPNVRLIEVSEENRDVLLPEILSALRS